MYRYVVIILFICSFAFSQKYEDVVYLKNGSEIHGTIIERAPNRYIKIKSGKNVFVYQISEIEKMTKEVIADSESDYFDMHSSIGIGLTTNKSANVVRYTYDLKLSRNTAIFAMVGYGVLFGLGIVWQQDYNDNGMMIGWSGGIDVMDWSVGSFSISYQWKLGNKPNFISLGISSAASAKYSEYSGELITSQVFLPIISLDRRF
mgnify:CR=1 FL=1|tara:strand:+ start:282 stop:893 length:612 start_codon:yes stop_codon:yes gene_type:complete